jgi:hypothetical protein
VFHAVPTGIADVEEEGVLVEGRRCEDGVLVAHDLLDIARETLAHAGRRRPVVVHHRAVLDAVDDERIHEECGSNFRGCVHEPVVVLEAVHGLVRRARVTVHDVPAGGRRDRERNGVLLVILHVHEQPGPIPVGVRRIENAVGTRQ